MQIYYIIVTSNSIIDTINVIMFKIIVFLLYKICNVKSSLNIYRVIIVLYTHVRCTDLILYKPFLLFYIVLISII